MVCVRITNGFGNNLFQYIAARLIAEAYRLPLTAVVAGRRHYGIEELAKLGIRLRKVNRPPFESVVTDDDYQRVLDHPDLQRRRILLDGYFEDYRHYLPHADRIRSWFTPVEKRFPGDLGMHLRTGDRLFMREEFAVKPRVEDYVAAIERFDFDRLHIVSDLPEWRTYTEAELREIRFHRPIPPEESVPLSDSVQYLNEFVERLDRYEPYFQSTSPAEDFDYLRAFDNVLFEHGTMPWWAAFIGQASKVGVYGPWRPWQPGPNRNLSQVPLDGWFTWDRLSR